MLDIAEHRQKLILKNLAQLDDRINEIQDDDSAVSVPSVAV